MAKNGKLRGFMKFSYTIAAGELDDYLAECEQTAPLEVTISVDAFGPEPDVGIMWGGVNFEGWDWHQTPVPEYEDAIENYFEENGEAIAESKVADYNDYLDDRPDRDDY